jgi:N-acetylglucosamine kinase-like BadF-type ATPase
MTSLILAGGDGGSTRTRIAITDTAGNLLGRAVGGPSNYGLVPDAELATRFDSLLAAVARCAGARRIDAVCIGSAGVTRREDFAALEAIVRRTTSVSLGSIRVDNDIITGLAGGVGQSHGIALIAGTGSACYGRDQHGRSWQAGGWEALVDDAGSAYRIALDALTAAVRAADRRGASTALTAKFFSALGINELPDIVSRLHRPAPGQPVVDKTYLASFAPMVFDCAFEGDAVAAEITRRAVNELACMVETVAHQLDWRGERIPLVLIGSVANCPAMRNPLAQRLAASLPHLEIVEPVLSPEGGAVLLAAEMAGLKPGPNFVANLQRGERTIPWS